MFLEDLSATLLFLCKENHLSYKAASERCCISSGHFGDITRGNTIPSILTLEKLCTGFHCTPNELLIPSFLQSEDAFRAPMLVTHIRCFKDVHGLIGFPVCPRCEITVEREYQAYCDRCGQHLDWSHFHQATVILPPK